MKYQKCMLLVVLVAIASCAGNPRSALMNEAEPLPGVTTSGQPDEAALRDLADDGFVAVIDLRGTDEDRGFEERGAVEQLGMTYISLPIAGASGITYENASVLDEVLSEIDGPILLHCASGNRVGALLSLRARMHGASSADALEIGTEAGLSSLRSTVEARLSER